MNLPENSEAPPTTGFELSKNLLWQDKIPTLINQFEWHDHLRFGVGSDPGSNTNLILVEGLRSDLPLGYSCHIGPHGLHFRKSGSEAINQRHYIGARFLPYFIR